MTNTLRTAALTLLLCAATAAAARAQMFWTDKAFLNVNAGGQVPSHDLKTAAVFELYGENGVARSTQDVGQGFLFDISAGYKVWRNLVVGLGYSRTSSDADININAEVPDELVRGRLRPATAAVSGVSHTQSAINLSGTWMVPVTDKIDVGLQFGPTIFIASQELPSAISVIEPGPMITETTLSDRDETTAGFHIGVDSTYLVTPRIGAGLLLRYVWGSADFEGTSDSVTLGGLQIGVGLRARF